MIRSTLVFLLCVCLAGPADAQAASWLDWLLGGDADDASEAAQATDERPAPVPPMPLDIESGLREALIVGSERVVSRLADADGFNGDPLIRIELPPALAQAREWLEKIGLAGEMDELETRMNRAAEAAAPRARVLFVDAIRGMSIDDARGILRGGDTAATDFLRTRMAPELSAEMRPVIDERLAEAGALQLLDAALTSYRRIPFAPPVEIDVTGYVSDATVEGIFVYLAREEQAIREDPARRTSELLRAVFSR